MADVVIPDVRNIVTAVALTLAMVLAGWLGRRQVVGVVILALLSFAWLTVDKLWEVTVLVRIVDTPQHRNGLTLADPVGLLGLVVAAVQAVVLWRRRRRARGRPRPAGDQRAG